MLIPAFKGAGARLRALASSNGVSGVHAGRKFGFEVSTTDTDGVLADPEVGAVVIATRHDSHADLVRVALEAGKHVFVEKPLALSDQELDAISADRAARQIAMSPAALRTSELSPHPIDDTVTPPSVTENTTQHLEADPPPQSRETT